MLPEFVSDESLNAFLAAQNAHATIKLTGRTFGRGSAWRRWVDVTPGNEQIKALRILQALEESADWARLSTFYDDSNLRISVFK